MRIRLFSSASSDDLYGGGKLRSLYFLSVPTARTIVVECDDSPDASAVKVQEVNEPT
jgi:hypothetical protein